jgi:HAD superfamily hydrolase (TIGR01509 family)
MPSRHFLSSCNHWIFDMDGTLTISQHDFEYIRKELGLPKAIPILEALNAMSAQEAEPLWQKLNELELFYAAKAKVMHGVIPLLEKLQARGAQLAILTRNTMPVVKLTLQACGIDHFFPQRYLLDRDSCQPKPSPEGIQHLLQLWDARPRDVVMVGDYLFDLQAGKGAGVTTIHIDPQGVFAWPEMSDICIREFAEIEVYIA